MLGNCWLLRTGDGKANARGFLWNKKKKILDNVCMLMRQVVDT